MPTTYRCEQPATSKNLNAGVVQQANELEMPSICSRHSVTHIGKANLRLIFLSAKPTGRIYPTCSANTNHPPQLNGVPRNEMFAETLGSVQNSGCWRINWRQISVRDRTVRVHIGSDGKCGPRKSQSRKRKKTRLMMFAEPEAIPSSGKDASVV